ncbi:hypothetical protein SAMN05192574_104664 [Mucilaginibacter gossypiicola]|uniref:Uncharacterized protein n=1 Tax=Mucilaginibacter gossypiicola TaxID=551995 RepID=A0A1H8KL25_9SPHI|nr:hypothetical protein SAMN05192574_104664 [Mucilaginibacter gossypiicola]
MLNFVTPGCFFLLSYKNHDICRAIKSIDILLNAVQKNQ